jgi:hypothetical protein
MKDINISLEEQTGGWFNVAIATLDELVECPAFLTNNNASSVVFAPATSGLDILPVGENIKITEPTQKTKSGTVYNIKGEFEIAYQSKEIDTYLKNYLHKKVVLIGIKHSGQQKLYGSKKFPLAFSYQFINGKNYEDGSKVRVIVTGKIPQKPVFIND